MTNPQRQKTRLPVGIITSGALVDSELQAEFGRIPPSFLPLGNRRLYEYQIEELVNKTCRLILTLPADFNPGKFDLERISSFQVDIVTIPAGLSLGSSIVHALNDTVALNHSSIILMHGDTLIRESNTLTLDSVSVERTFPSEYRWGHVLLRNDGVEVTDHPQGHSDGVLTGLFCFSDSSHLVQSITNSNYSFIAGLNKYSRRYPLKATFAGNWFDFGHVVTFYKSKRKISTSRHFNTVNIEGRVFEKTSLDAKKIASEARWFEDLPPHLRTYTPAYLGARQVDECVSYKLEYQNLPTLAEMFVFGLPEESTWSKVFTACNEVLCEFHNTSEDEMIDTYHRKKNEDLYKIKTLRRLDEFSRQTNTCINKPCRYNGHAMPDITRIVDMAEDIIRESPQVKTCLIHGDFCFSNLFYNNRAELIKVVDPRAVDANNLYHPWGDPRYDVAKLHHSVIGFYDHITSGNFSLKVHGDLSFELELPNDDRVSKIKRSFEERSFSKIKAGGKDILAISVLLFFSMLPMHSDSKNRQLALLSNGLRLFRMLDQ